MSSAPGKSRTHRTTAHERETVIQFDDGGRVVTVRSASPAVWRKLARMGWRVKETTRDPEGRVSGIVYEPVPLTDFRWGLKRRASPAQREAARKALSLRQGQRSRVDLSDMTVTRRGET